MSDRTDSSEAVFTGSTWTRVDRCPPSAILPGQVRSESERADVGSAIHEHMALRTTVGVAVAVEQIEATARRWNLDEKAASIFRARCLHFEWSPPRGAIAEMPLCLCEDGSVHVAQGSRGKYAGLPRGAYFALTLDIMWAEPAPLVLAHCEGCGAPTAGKCHACKIVAAPPQCPEDSTLWVVDYKTGSEVHVHEAEHNDQVLAGALLAARWTGAKTVLPAILYPRKGQGLWDVPEASFLVEEFEPIEKRLRRTHTRALEQRRKLTAGEPLDFTTGPHCEFCPAETRCTAKVGMLRAFVGREAPASLEALTDEEAHTFAVMLPQLERFLNNSKAAMKAHVERTGRPIQLRHGRVWGPHEVTKTVVLPKVAIPILAAEVGEERAANAVKTTLSREAIEDAVKDAHLERGIARKVAPTVRQLMGIIGARGGLLSETRVEWSAYAPPPPEPKAREAHASAEPIEIDEGD